MDKTQKFIPANAHAAAACGEPTIETMIAGCRVTIHATAAESDQCSAGSDQSAAAESRKPACDPYDPNTSPHGRLLYLGSGVWMLACIDGAGRKYDGRISALDYKAMSTAKRTVNQWGMPGAN